MSIVPFSFELAQQIYNSTKRFPVCFDQAWQWMEYSRKDSAKRVLEKNFKNGEDYALHKVVERVNGNNSGGSVTVEQIFLTANCFKEMGMMAGTAKGREIRQYFIRCEEKLKELLQSQSQQPTVKDELEVINLCLSVAGLDPKLTAGVMLNHAGTRIPELKGAVQEGHELLAASGQTELLLTPTKIGKQLGISNRKVNEILLAIDFQVKNTGKISKTEPDYFVTESGKPYAGNTMATGKLQEKGADNSTYQHLKWKESVIDVIRGQL
jgi:phage anti-repressor protein